MKTIIIYGLKRSGNHFLISTIIQQFSNYVHINDTNLSYDNYNTYKNIDKTVDYIDFNWTGFKDVECVVISLENKIINSNEINNFKQIDNCFFLILLRCPYCHFSSIWKVYNKNNNKLLKIIELWKIYAEYFLNNDNDKFIKVIYDEYASNNNYINNILHKLNIFNIIIDKNKKIKHQESSFDKQKSNKKQQIYKTLENCIFNNDIAFLELVKDKKIDDLWYHIKTKFLNN